MKEQKVVTLDAHDGAYYNFFWTPGSINSLATHIKDGWRITFIKDDQSNQRVVCIFEKEEALDPHSCNPYKYGDRVEILGLSIFAADHIGQYGTVQDARGSLVYIIPDNDKLQIALELKNVKLADA